MPMDRSRYPKGWNAIATFLKTVNDWQCAQCGRPCRRPGETTADLQDRINSLPLWKSQFYEKVYDEDAGDWASIPRPVRFQLGVAHLDHNPPNIALSNLLPLCTVCHGRYDITPQAMARKLQLKLEHHGQLRIPGVE